MNILIVLIAVLTALSESSNAGEFNPIREGFASTFLYAGVPLIDYGNKDYKDTIMVDIPTTLSKMDRIENLTLSLSYKVKKASVYRVYSNCYFSVVGQAIVQSFQNGERFTKITTTNATASAAYVNRLGKGLTELDYKPTTKQTLRLYCSIKASQKGITDGLFNVKVSLAGSIAKYIPDREELAKWSVKK